MSAGHTCWLAHCLIKKSDYLEEVAWACLGCDDRGKLVHESNLVSSLTRSRLRNLSGKRVCEQKKVHGQFTMRKSREFASICVHTTKGWIDILKT